MNKRVPRSCRSISPTSPAQHRLTPHFPLLIPIHAERLRLKAFSLPQCLLCAGRLPDLGKTGDARSGFSSPILICIKSQKTLHKTTQIVMLSEVETSQTKEEEKNTEHCLSLSLKLLAWRFFTALRYVLKDSKRVKFYRKK